MFISSSIYRQQLQSQLDTEGAKNWRYCQPTPWYSINNNSYDSFYFFSCFFTESFGDGWRRVMVMMRTVSKKCTTGENVRNRYFKKTNCSANSWFSRVVQHWSSYFVTFLYASAENTEITGYTKDANNQLTFMKNRSKYFWRHFITNHWSPSYWPQDFSLTVMKLCSPVPVSPNEAKSLSYFK